LFITISQTNYQEPQSSIHGYRTYRLIRIKNDENPAIAASGIDGWLD
jgi:hypothetical protein